MTRQSSLLPSKTEIESTIFLFEDVTRQVYEGKHFPDLVTDTFQTIHSILEGTIPVADGTLPIPGIDLAHAFTSFLCKLILCPTDPDSFPTRRIVRKPRAPPALSRRVDAPTDDPIIEGLADGSIPVTPLEVPQLAPKDVEELLPTLLDSVKSWRYLFDTESQNEALAVRAPTPQEPAPAPAPAPAPESPPAVEVRVRLSEGAVREVTSTIRSIVDALRRRPQPRVQDPKPTGGN